MCVYKMCQCGFIISAAQMLKTLLICFVQIKPFRPVVDL